MRKDLTNDSKHLRTIHSHALNSEDGSEHVHSFTSLNAYSEGLLLT